MNRFCNGKEGRGSYFSFKFWFTLFIPLGKLSAVGEGTRIFELGRNGYESGPLVRVISIDQMSHPTPHPCTRAQL